MGGLNVMRQVRWWLAEEAYNERHKRIEIPADGMCDFCNRKMKYAGANFKTHVIRACAFHLNKAKKTLKDERIEYGIDEIQGAVGNVSPSKQSKPKSTEKTK